MTKVRLITALLAALLSVTTQALTVTDDRGVEHTLEKPVSRIVSLMPHGTELLFEVGAGDLVVGAVDYSDYPQAAKKIPRVGGYSGLNLEAIMALQPDIVLAWPEGNNQRELDRLKQLGFQLFASDPRDFAAIADNLERLGKLTGNDEQGLRAAQAFRAKTQQLAEQYQHQQDLTVFYQVWNKPLLSQNGSTFISRAIELCGGHNIFADLPMAAPQVSIEAVLAANPQVIVASGMGESRPEWLDDWRGYAQLSAVQTNSLYHIHPELFHRPTSRFLIGTEQLCQQMAATRQRMQSGAAPAE